MQTTSSIGGCLRTGAMARTDARRRRLASRLAGAAAILLAVSGRASADTILFIGNSFTYGASSPVQQFRPETVTDLNGTGMGGVPALFKAFADESGLHYDVSLEAVASMGLDFHFREKRALIARAYDHVVMQTYSTLDADAPGHDGKLIEFSGRLADVLHGQNSNVDVRLVATWSRADQTYLPQGHWYGRPIAAMALDVRAACDRAVAASSHIRSVIPVGEAWNRAMEMGLAESNPYAPGAGRRLNLWAPDSYHASTAGYFLEALVIFGAVTGRDPRTLGRDESAARALDVPADVVIALERVAALTLRARPVAPRGSKPR